MFFRKFPRFSGYSRPSSSTIRSALWGNAHRSLAALGVLLATVFSAMASRGPTSENSDMENANKPASSWPLKQGPKKWSKHGCDKGTLTVATGLGTHKEKRYELTFMFKLQGRKSACTTCAGSREILRWLTPFLGPNMDPKMGSRIGSHFHSFF